MMKHDKTVEKSGSPAKDSSVKDGTPADQRGFGWPPHDKTVEKDKDPVAPSPVKEGVHQVENDGERVADNAPKPAPTTAPDGTPRQTATDNVG